MMNIKNLKFLPTTERPVHLNDDDMVFVKLRNGEVIKDLVRKA